jgi:hypothetical protein
MRRLEGLLDVGNASVAHAIAWRPAGSCSARCAPETTGAEGQKAATSTIDMLYNKARSTGVRSTPRSTPGVPGVTSTSNGNGHGPVVPEKAQQALERLLNKKSAPGV